MEAISTQASVQLTNWLLAKDQRQHCCPLCCLGFQTEPELYVHLKHTAVHQVNSLSLECRTLEDQCQVLPACICLHVFELYLPACMYLHCIFTVFACMYLHELCPHAAEQLEL